MTPDKFLKDLAKLKNRLESNEIEDFFQRQEEGIRKNLVLYRQELGILIGKVANAELNKTESKLRELSEGLNAGMNDLDSKITAMNDAVRIGLAMLKLCPILAQIEELVEVNLTPAYFLNDTWQVTEPIPAVKLYAFPPWKSEPDEEDIINAIRATRIEVASNAETKRVNSGSKFDYLKSELGMNIIVPIGVIEEMRFKVTLQGNGEGSDKVLAIDGFPKDVIEEKQIVAGKIKLGITKSFKFVPVVGTLLADLLDIDLNPWEFKLGNLRRVNVDFSGGLTSRPEWYFRRNGIRNDLRVALTIKKPKSVMNIKAEIQAAWIYDPGFLRKARVGTDKKAVEIYAK